MSRFVALSLLVAGLVGETAPVAPAPSPDPTAAVVAEGQFLYRQRDLDALVLIAQRHTRQKLSRLEEDQLRQALIAGLPAREPLLEIAERLPASLTGKARDQFLLDLLDYEAERVPPKPITPGDVPPASAAAPQPAPATTSSGPVLVRLPDLVLNRQLDGIGKRQLTLGLAFSFADAAVSKTFEAKAAILQDAILGYLHGLPANEFAEPNQITLKAGLTKAIQSKLADFPADAVLIPQLDVGAPETK